MILLLKEKLYQYINSFSFVVYRHELIHAISIENQRYYILTQTGL